VLANAYVGTALIDDPSVKRAWLLVEGRNVPTMTSRERDENKAHHVEHHGLA
jgi:hypothetical protein